MSELRDRLIMTDVIRSVAQHRYVVNLFTTMSAAIVYNLLAVFLVKVLEASIAILNLMEGATKRLIQACLPPATTGGALLGRAAYSSRPRSKHISLRCGQQRTSG
jgi:hypothetical protein